MQSIFSSFMLKAAASSNASSTGVANSSKCNVDCVTMCADVADLKKSRESYVTSTGNIIKNINSSIKSVECEIEQINCRINEGIKTLAKLQTSYNDLKTTVNNVQASIGISITNVRSELKAVIDNNLNLIKSNKDTTDKSILEMRSSFLSAIDKLTDNINNTSAICNNNKDQINKLRNECIEYCNKIEQLGQKKYLELKETIASQIDKAGNELLEKIKQIYADSLQSIKSEIQNLENDLKSLKKEGQQKYEEVMSLISTLSNKVNDHDISIEKGIQLIQKIKEIIGNYEGSPISTRLCNLEAAIEKCASKETLKECIDTLRIEVINKYDIDIVQIRQEIKEIRDSLGNGGTNCERSCYAQHDRIFSQLTLLEETIRRCQPDEINKIKQDFQKIKQDLESLSVEMLCKIEKLLQHTDNSIENHTTQINIIKQDIEEVKKILAACCTDNTIIDKVTALEAQLTSTNTNVDQIQASIKAILCDIKAIQTQISKHDTNIEGLKQDIENIKQQIKQLPTGCNVNINAKIDAIIQRIETIENQGNSSCSNDIEELKQELKQFIKQEIQNTDDDCDDDDSEYDDDESNYDDEDCKRSNHKCHNRYRGNKFKRVHNRISKLQREIKYLNRDDEIDDIKLHKLLDRYNKLEKKVNAVYSEYAENNDQLIDISDRQPFSIDILNNTIYFTTSNDKPFTSLNATSCNLYKSNYNLLAQKESVSTISETRKFSFNLKVSDINTMLGPICYIVASNTFVQCIKHRGDTAVIVYRKSTSGTPVLTHIVFEDKVYHIKETGYTVTHFCDDYRNYSKITYKYTTDGKKLEQDLSNCSSGSTKDQFTASCSGLHGVTYDDKDIVITTDIVLKQCLRISFKNGKVHIESGNRKREKAGKSIIEYTIPGSNCAKNN